MIASANAALRCQRCRRHHDRTRRSGTALAAGLAQRRASPAKAPPPGPDEREIIAVLRAHLDSMLRFYGTTQGLRIARKHIGWYAKTLPGLSPLVASFNRLQTTTDLAGWIVRLDLLALKPAA